jgi:hypothetical protein
MRAVLKERITDPEKAIYVNSLGCSPELFLLHVAGTGQKLRSNRPLAALLHQSS